MMRSNTPMSGDPILRVRGMRKTFLAEPARARASCGSNLDVAPGEFITIIGPSGCGKTSLLNAIADVETGPDPALAALTGARPIGPSWSVRSTAPDERRLRLTHPDGLHGRPPITQLNPIG
jgi:ABC-type glutathione transport system ATPase component